MKHQLIVIYVFITIIIVFSLIFFLWLSMGANTQDKVENLQVNNATMLNQGNDVEKETVELDIDTCKSLDDLEERDSCYASLGEHTGNFMYCNLIESELERDKWCYFEIGYEHKNFNACEFIIHPDIKDQCFYAVITEKLEDEEEVHPSNCQLITNLESREYCLELVMNANEYTQPPIAQEIEEEVYKNIELNQKNKLRADDLSMVLKQETFDSISNCINQGGFVNEPITAELICKDNPQLGIWPDISMYQATWGGCDFKIDRVTSSASYCVKTGDILLNCGYMDCAYMY